MTVENSVRVTQNFKRTTTKKTQKRPLVKKSEKKNAIENCSSIFLGSFGHFNFYKLLQYVSQFFLLRGAISPQN
jgi:hypothetical protein